MTPYERQMAIAAAQAQLDRGTCEALTWCGDDGECVTRHMAAGKHIAARAINGTIQQASVVDDIRSAQRAYCKLCHQVFTRTLPAQDKLPC